MKAKTVYKAMRPDIFLTVNIVSGRMNATNNQHWLCGKQLLRHLQGAKVLRRTYSKEAGYDLLGEIDADCSGDVNEKKSTTDYYFKLNGRGAPIS